MSHEDQGQNPDMGEVSSFEAWWQETGQGELRLILWAAWDPIGGVPRDEYDWYVPRLWPLIQEHATVLFELVRLHERRAPDTELEAQGERAEKSEARIAAQLTEWRTERIGNGPDPVTDRAVAAKITDWLSPPDIDHVAPIDLLR